MQDTLEDYYEHMELGDELDMDNSDGHIIIVLSDKLKFFKAGIAITFNNGEWNYISLDHKPLTLKDFRNGGMPVDFINNKQRYVTYEEFNLIKEDQSLVQDWLDKYNNN